MNHTEKIKAALQKCLKQRAQYFLFPYNKTGYFSYWGFNRQRQQEEFIVVGKAGYNYLIQNHLKLFDINEFQKKQTHFYLKK